MSVCVYMCCLSVNVYTHVCVFYEYNYFYFVFQIFHGFKANVGDQNWQVFVAQFPPQLRTKLTATYQI